MEFKAKARFTRVSPQKARLVLDLIKGKRVEDALTTLTFTKKRMATDVLALLRSAVQNADGRSEIGKSFRRERSILRLKKGSNIWDKKSIHTDFASATPSRGGHAGSWSATTTSCFWKM